MPVRVEYKDEENDLITITSQVEWDEFIKSHQGKLANLWIKSHGANSLLLPAEQLGATVDIKQKEEDLKNKQLEEEKAAEEALRKKEEEEKAAEEELRKNEAELAEKLRKQHLEEEEEEKALEEELRKKEEELSEKLKKRAEDMKTDRKKQEEEKARKEELKKIQDAKHKICLEKLKEMEKQIKAKEEQINNTTATPALKANYNQYIKQYSAKLQNLHEAGFTDMQRNLYLLITFNGDMATVIDQLLGVK